MTNMNDMKLKEDRNEERPTGNLKGLATYFRQDFVSGFLVFLIALPLCLGISLASGFPAVAGIITAIVGSVVTTHFSNSEMTVKGPAAGLIVIMLGTVTEFGFTGGQDLAADFQAYRAALAVAFAAGILQIAFGLFRTGALGDFFPTSAVHGMLAAIGVIIIAKQLPVTVGQNCQGEPLEILCELPRTLAQANPEIALIGIISLGILFVWPWIKSKLNYRLLHVIPGPMLVLFVAIPLGMFFDLSHEHTYSFMGHDFSLSERFLVDVPPNLFKALAHPDFSALQSLAGWKWVLVVALIGSLESVLSAKAIDLFDPWKRKTDFNRDLMAVGLANVCSTSIGGLPMISEIVRSRANIDNGARTRFANFWHGMFLLFFVALLPGLIHRIPLAALAAMLVYTGFRLASPREFLHAFQIGREQLVIFAGTLVAVLLTDLLIGIAIGVGLKILIHLLYGVPVRSLFRPRIDVSKTDDSKVLISANDAAVFSNWLPLKRKIQQAEFEDCNHVVVNLSGTKFVDHSVMTKLQELEMEFKEKGLLLEITGLEGHQKLSEHPQAARKRQLTALKRITMVSERELESILTEKLLQLGAAGYTTIPCRGTGRQSISPSVESTVNQVLIESVVPEVVGEKILEFVSQNQQGDHRVIAYMETVQVWRADQFE